MAFDAFSDAPTPTRAEIMAARDEAIGEQLADGPHDTDFENLCDRDIDGHYTEEQT